MESFGEVEMLMQPNTEHMRLWRPSGEAAGLYKLQAPISNPPITPISVCVLTAAFRKQREARLRASRFRLGS